MNQDIKSGEKCVLRGGGGGQVILLVVSKGGGGGGQEYLHFLWRGGSCKILVMNQDLSRPPLTLK